MISLPGKSAAGLATAVTRIVHADIVSPFTSPVTSYSGSVMLLILLLPTSFYLGSIGPLSALEDDLAVGLTA